MFLTFFDNQLFPHSEKIRILSVFSTLLVVLNSIELSSQGGVINKGVQFLHDGILGESSYPHPLIPEGNNRHLSKEHLPFSENSHIYILIQGSRHIASGPLVPDRTNGGWVLNCCNAPGMTDLVDVLSPQENRHFKANLHRFDSVPFDNAQESHCYITDGQDTYYARLYTDEEAVGSQKGFSIVKIVAQNPHSGNQQLWIGILQRFPGDMHVPDWAKYRQ